MAKQNGKTRRFSGFLSTVAKLWNNMVDVELTNKERQVFNLLMEGRKTEEIAASLGKTKNTVKYYTKRIYKKLDVKSKPELILRYLK